MLTFRHMLRIGLLMVVAFAAWFQGQRQANASWLSDRIEAGYTYVEERGNGISGWTAERERVARSYLADREKALRSGLPFSGGSILKDVFEPTIERAETAGKAVVHELDESMKNRIVQAKEVASALIQQSNEVGLNLIDTANARMQDRILQIDVATEKRIDQLLGGVDSLADKQWMQLNEAVTRVDQKVSDQIKNIDAMLGTKIDLISDMVTSSISQADEAIGRRIVEADEIIEKRLGNVDVILTKAILRIEEVLQGIIGFICILVIVAAVIWTCYLLWAKGVSLVRRGQPWWKYVRNVLKQVGQPLALNVGGGVVACIIVYIGFIFASGLYGHKSELEQLTQKFVHTYNVDLKAFDFTHAKYSASQLKQLDPTNLHYHLMAERAVLLQDLFTRPLSAEIATQRLNTIENLSRSFREIDGRDSDNDAIVDRDLLVAKAFIQWRKGQTRLDELEAAMLCALALISEETGTAYATDFPLAPLAINYIRSYLEQPLPSHRIVKSYFEEKYTKHDTRMYRTFVKEFEKSEAILRKVSNNITEKGDLNPSRLPDFHSMLEYNQEVIRLTRLSNDNYWRMVKSYARKTVEERNDAAEDVLEAWKSFDKTLTTNQLVSRDMNAKLALFSLNDAILSHATWFVVNPTSEFVCPPFFEGRDYSPAEARQFLKCAPLRIAWRNRFEPQLGVFSTAILDSEGTKVFFDMDDCVRRFEENYKLLVASDIGSGFDRDEFFNNGVNAYKSAADLGLYVGSDADGERRHLCEFVREYVEKRCKEDSPSKEKRDTEEEKLRLAEDYCIERLLERRLILL